MEGYELIDKNIYYYYEKRIKFSPEIKKLLKLNFSSFIIKLFPYNEDFFVRIVFVKKTKNYVIGDFDKSLFNENLKKYTFDSNKVRDFLCSNV